LTLHFGGYMQVIDTSLIRCYMYLKNCEKDIIQRGQLSNVLI
jgi:hypothetical protein